MAQWMGRTALACILVVLGICTQAAAGGFVLYHKTFGDWSVVCWRQRRTPKTVVIALIWVSSKLLATSAGTIDLKRRIKASSSTGEGAEASRVVA